MTHWIRFEHDGAVGFGTLTDGSIAVHAGDLFLQPAATGETLALDDVTVLPPTAAGKMLALWNNSRAMGAKTGTAPPSTPLYFIRGNGSYLGGGGTIRKPPAYDGKVIYEGELGIVIGRRVSAADDVPIFGYTCVNDVTAIDIVKEDPAFMQWTRAKSFDTFGVCGPVVATGLDPAALTIRTVLNGEERQCYGVDDLYFQPADIVRAIARDLTLHPGDVISCGTSVGVGSMKPGSTVEVTIDGIGTLRNRYEV